MDHTYIEENQVADRYVQGTLPADEAERFENHYLSCPECLDSLDLAESVQRGFRRAATQDAEKIAAGRQLAILAWLMRLSRQGQAGILLSALLVVILLPAGFGLQMARSGRELAMTRAALAGERQRTAAAGTLSADLEASRRALAGERAAHEQAVQQIAQLQQPQANVPVRFLDKERGAGSSSEAPTQTLRRPATGQIVLAPQVDRSFPSYRARLLDGRGHEICRVPDLHPDDHDALGIGLPVSLLPPGDYTLVVEGVAPGGKTIPAGRYTLRITPD
jgi:hypothetical protein